MAISCREYAERCVIMHELSIATALAESLINYSREHHVRIKVAHIKVGLLSGIDPEALKFAWAPALENACSNVLTDCVLQITLAPISHQCRECGKIFEFDKWTLKCPACGMESLRRQNGSEFVLESIEVEDV